MQITKKTRDEIKALLDEHGEITTAIDVARNYRAEMYFAKDGTDDMVVSINSDFAIQALQAQLGFIEMRLKEYQIEIR